MNDGNNRVLVLADDFTGANDAGVSGGGGYVGGSGLHRRTAINRPGINSQQRQQGDDRRGGGQGRRSAARAATFVPHWQVKKIDSTLRGNPGGELEAMMAAQGCRMAVVAPAYPAAGRHTRTGAAMCMACPSIRPNLPAIRKRR